MEEPLGGADDAQVPAMAEGGEQEHELLIPDLPNEGDTASGKMNAGQNDKKWVAYWLLVLAASAIVLNNHIHAAPKDQLFPPELAMLTVFLCAICLIFHAMKKQMM